MDLNPTQKKVVSPREYANLSPSEKAHIKYARIIPPRIGSRRNAFGRIEVTYKTPVYAVAENGE